MIENILHSRLMLQPESDKIILVFFAYSFLGYLLECTVLTVEKRRIVINRGFTSHLPFCIIYGFGAILGYALLSPFKDNLPLLFLMGAVSATCLEFIVAQMQLNLFNSFWWDYSNKPFNYKGILCLESTLGWGFVAIFVVRLLHRTVVAFVNWIPQRMEAPLAAFLLTAYCVDFLLGVRVALHKKRQEQEEARVLYYDYDENREN